MAYNPTSMPIEPENPTLKQNMGIVSALRQAARQQTKEKGYRTGIGGFIPAIICQRNIWTHDGK